MARNSGEGTFTLLKIAGTIAGLYAAAATVAYVIIRIGADANKDGLVTAEEYATNKAAVLTGSVNTILSPGVDFVESLVIRVFPYHVPAVTP